MLDCSQDQIQRVQQHILLGCWSPSAPEHTVCVYQSFFCQKHQAEATNVGAIEQAVYTSRRQGATLAFSWSCVFVTR